MACGILSGTFHWGRNKGPHLTLHIIQYALNFWCVELSSGMRGRFNHDLIRDPLSFGRDVASAIICSLLKLTLYLIPLKKPNLCFRVEQSLSTRVDQFKSEFTVTQPSQVVSLASSLTSKYGSYKRSV